MQKTQNEQEERGSGKWEEGRGQQLSRSVLFAFDFDLCARAEVLAKQN